ncbi:uncharacterized protein LOC131679046 [Topomyia yanbarensis]|uniref:uncharacterized protein LOC131679046 n=1 Tax=Topomyia yanbarensis TaxID=2498891 RepID=UPI00273C4239|nr:uncharacterized protein LOC131679046 [Topomyia yanbarensis]
MRMGILIGRMLIFTLLKLVIVCNLLSAAENEDFQMINLYEEVEKNDNYSRVSWYVASERSSVECGGVFKRLQTELISPEYPDNYGDELRCEYTFKSPFVCSSQYHFQFLDFGLEPSRNCYKDRLVIGGEEILCGTVIGSKKYNSTNGILKVKFVTDGWGSDKGFRILVTRQPCDDNEVVESSTAYTVYSTIQVSDETTLANSGLEDELLPPKKSFTVNSRQDIPPDFNPGNNGYLPPVTQNPPSYPINACPQPCNYYSNCYPNNPGSVQPTYPSYPVYPNYPVIPNYPTYPSYPQIPGTIAPNNPTYPNGNYPTNNFPIYPSYPITPIYPNPNCQYNPSVCSPNYPTYPTNNGDGTNSIGGAPPGYQPTVKDPEIELAENTTSDQPQRQDIPPPPGLPPAIPGIQRCCRNVYNQKRFYLVSPNFPSYQTANMDCYYQIYRYSPNTCRLIISFKYFLLGDDRTGCSDAFLEIDGRRICGCRTGMVYTSQWSNLPKTIRVRSRINRFSNVQGFVLDVYQETCPYRYIRSHQPAAQDRQWTERPVHTVTPANVTTVQTNSTSLYSYYYFTADQSQQEETKAVPTIVQRHPEGPSSRFYYPNNVNSYGSCTFNGLDWLRLKVESLWIAKPGCY